MRRKTLLSAVLFVTFALYVLPAAAMFMRTDEPVPVDRLIQNLQAYIKANPKDAAGYYTLGRVHGLAYAKDGAQIDVTPAKEAGKLPSFAVYRSVQEARRDENQKLTDAARDHLVRSIENYRKATELDPKSGLYWLGYGWMLQQAHLQKLDLAPQRDSTKPSTDWRADALAAYRKAFDLTHQKDLKGEHLLHAGDSFISNEAARNALALLEELPDSPEKKKDIETYRRFQEEFMKKPMAVTPIVFPLDRDRPLAELVDNDRTVGFDLAGFGLDQKWPWLKPGTGILAWDPNQTGRIESGRQLFGSVTWWMFWQDGYQPLAMLDDNRDGSLSGEELKGIAVWSDRNADGVSDPGEVVPAERAGITRIATRPTREAGVLQSSGGIVFSDGRTVTSYDWEPVSRE
jgi:hypothetical protein